MRLFYCCLSLLLGSLLFAENALASVLAIDYGTDWIKASLIKPGVPFDVLLNKDSKRKIQSSVAWKQNDRLFGGDAFNIAGRFPSDSFSSLKYLQGVPYESETVEYYKSISTVDVVRTPRDTAALKRSDGTEWSVEELIGMQFAYVKELAEGVAGEKVYDVIVTVPPYYTQFERDAVVDAIEVAGLRTLALINDGTAVAVNYAMTRSFATPEYHVIYDAGASSIRATVVSFSSASSDPKSKSKDSTSLSVAGVGFDRSVGGTELDRRLREMLVKDFERKHKKEIRSDKRAMAKLWKEAGRVKAILSANADATASVESLTDDIDYRSKISRADFEVACADMKGRYARPIFDALASAGLTLDNVTSVILTGGSSRTPMVQAAVKAAVGENKIALNVNADEAAVLGAALHGAGLSRQFKTKDIKIQDIGAYDIQVSYPAELKSETSKPRQIHSLVFPAGSKTGSKKTMTFKRKDDFPITLQYRETPLAGLPSDILQADIQGVAEAIQNLTDAGAIDPVVKATIVLSDSGFASVHDAVAYGEIKDDSITGKLKGFFGGGSSSSTEEDGPTEPETAVRPEETDSEAKSADTAAESSAPVKAVPKTDTIPLEVDVKFISLAPMTVAEKREARQRLAAVDNEEAAKRRREEARNSLEGYLYRVRDLLDDASETPFAKCSQEPERKAIAEKLQETFAWLNEEGDTAETWQYLDKRSSIESLERPIIHRYKEIEEFPHALNNSQKWNWSTRMFLTDAKAALAEEEAGGPPSKYTKEELDALEKTLKEHETWLNEWVEKQKSVKMNEDPVILTSEMRARAKTLENHLQRLVKKKVPKPKKTAVSLSAEPLETAPPDSEESTTTTTSASETESPSASTSPVSTPHADIHDEL